MLTVYFSEKELACPCCGEIHMDKKFMQLLERTRMYAQIPMNVNSGYRCEKHNADPEVGGKPNSSHLRGKAADIAIATSSQRFTILAAAIKAGFTRIGIGKTFIHLDSDDTKAQEVSWIY